jgi:hypothetical protein
VTVVPHILTAADVAERLYKLVRKVQDDRLHARELDTRRLAAEVDELRDRVREQALAMEAREREIADLRKALDELRAPKRRWFGIG